MTWKTLPQYPAYEVSSNGEVRKSGHRAPLTPSTDAMGGKTLQVRDKRGDRSTVRVARLVGEAFCPDFRPHFRTVYLNGKKHDCRAANLKWVSISEATVAPHGCMQGQSKLTWANVLAIRDSNEPLSTLSERYGVSDATISNVRRFQTWNPDHAPKYLRKKATSQRP